MSVWKQTAKAATETVKIPIPTPGQHPAVLAAIVDLGTTKDHYRDSGKEYTKREVCLCWELEDEDAKEGGPRFFVVKDYSLTFGESSRLRQMIEDWRGRKFAAGEDFDVEKLLGQPCFVKVIHAEVGKNKRTVAQITGVSKLPKGVQPIKPTHQPFLSQVDDGQELPDWLPYLYGRPIAEHVAECEERKGAPPAGKGDAHDELEVADLPAAGDPF